MSKKQAVSVKQANYPYPSWMGSHSSMVVKEETERLHDEDLVVCRDEFGLYVTERKNLDNGMADSYRNMDPQWREKFNNEKLGQIFEILI